MKEFLTYIWVHMGFYTHFKSVLAGCRLCCLKATSWWEEDQMDMTDTGTGD